MEEIDIYEIKALKQLLLKEKSKLNDLRGIAETGRINSKESLWDLLKKAGIKNAYMEQSEKVVNIERGIRGLESKGWREKGIKTAIVGN